MQKRNKNGIRNIALLERFKYIPPLFRLWKLPFATSFPQQQKIFLLALKISETMN